MQPDHIEKSVELHAPVPRVWQALTDHRQFGEWFGVRVETPFEPGEQAQGQITHPSYDHLTWHAVIQDIEAEQYFAFTWHPYAVDPKVDYSKETPTLVEFRLQPTASGGTILTLTELGFSDLPDERREEAFTRNEGGWTQQMKNIADYVSRNP